MLMLLISAPGGTLSGSSWSESYKKAASLVNKMSLIEKVNITTGTGWAMGQCVGNTGDYLNLISLYIINTNQISSPRLNRRLSPPLPPRRPPRHPLRPQRNRLPRRPHRRRLLQPHPPPAPRDITRARSASQGRERHLRTRDGPVGTYARWRKELGGIWRGPVFGGRCCWGDCERRAGGGGYRYGWV